VICCGAVLGVVTIGVVAAPSPAMSRDSRALVVQPGRGIGPVVLGGSRSAFVRRFPAARSSRRQATLRLPSGVIRVVFLQGRIVDIESTGRSLYLDGRRIRSRVKPETSSLKSAGWKIRGCGEGTSTAYRTVPGPPRARLTTIDLGIGPPDVSVQFGDASSFGCATVGGPVG
jgi:hypothetical protein